MTYIYHCLKSVADSYGNGTLQRYFTKVAVGRDVEDLDGPVLKELIGTNTSRCSPPGKSP